MRWPRKGIVIRLFIYGPLFGYFGWQAWEKRAERQEAAVDGAKEAADPLAGVKQRTVTLPDGSEQVVYEVTPEQAERLLGTSLDEADAEARPSP